MSTLLTTENDNDLFLDSSNNIALSTSREEEIIQLIKNTLQLFLGEIYTDLDAGVDYFGIIFDKFIALPTKVEELVDNILAVDGVLGIQNISYVLEDSIYNFEFTVQTDIGDITLSDLQLIL